MKLIDRLRIANYHRKRSKQFGSQRAKVLGWQDEHSQVTRFEALSRACHFDGRSVLDLGCGFGDLLAFIEAGSMRPAEYVGIDQQRSFIREARRRQFVTPARFIRGDFSRMPLPQSDYVVVSGSLNYQSSQADHTAEMIKKMYQASNRACVFNLLDQAKLPNMQLLESHNKQGVLRYCRYLCPQSELIEGYSEHDFTIAMIKEAEPDD
ncbi:class I SAM-dependent methyltransferase [Vibrio sp. CAU 1672]|uniref:class I SAM-dependent methyltransferase n=1 Tax=Vibrio sp. CAU 1672 TaxID=3032594 RepID=UPI0023D9B4D8|nr:class I SAM-dependent methyltransferase [Vibrio sp. CAU 1672]MDF2155331.1 class I SAM-dependent methyltransferase [Vibrio sp. CAU 1672]